MADITDNDIYLERMRKALFDKAFWIDKIDPNTTTVIDMGCATGDLFRFIEDMFPGKFRFIGIENNKDFLANAYSNATYYTDIHDVENDDWEHSILVMNSVIHEIYSYCGNDAFKEILTYVFNKSVNHVAIREMDLSYPGDYDSYYVINWANDVVVTASNKYEKQWKEHLASYEADAPKNIIERAAEFVLKYQYTENWEREVNERYLHQEMIGDIGYAMSKYNFRRENDDGSFYYFDYELPFSIPQQVDRIAADFGSFPDELNTHVKLLITRNNLNGKEID